MELLGRTVFITGGAQGIGKAVMEALLDRGAKVVFCDNDIEVSAFVEGELKGRYDIRDFDYFHCDVGNPTQLYDAFQVAVRRFGHVEICINNAGIIDEFEWEKALNINMTAQIRGCKIAFDHMRRDYGGRGGVIINMVSVDGYTPNKFCPIYAASQHAMIGYTTSCARDAENEGAGVRWSCVCPSAVNTGFLDVEGKVKDPEEMVSKRPLAIEPQVVAKALIELLQDTRSNGKILEVTAKGARYRQRVMVDEDGESNKVEVDGRLIQRLRIPGSPEKTQQ